MPAPPDPPALPVSTAGGVKGAVSRSLVQGKTSAETSSSSSGQGAWRPLQVSAFAATMSSQSGKARQGGRAESRVRANLLVAPAASPPDGAAPVLLFTTSPKVR